MKEKTFIKLSTLPLVPFITLCLNQSKATAAVNTQRIYFKPNNDKITKKDLKDLYSNILEEIQKNGRKVKAIHMIAFACY